MAKKINIKLTTAEILELNVHCSSQDETMSIQEYLCGMLLKLWEEKEGFSGKRPYGNSCWENDLYMALVAGGAVRGSICSEEVDGEVIYEELGDCDYDSAKKAIENCIVELMKVQIR